MVNRRRVSILATMCLAMSIMTVWIPALHAEQGSPGMDLFVDGLESYDNGDYEEALNTFDQAIEKDGSNLQFQYYYGLTYSKMGKDPEAISIFTAILSSDPKTFSNVYFDLAGIYIRQKDYDKAKRILDDAEWTVPNNPRVYMEKGYLARMLKDYPGAEANFKRALELSPDSVQTVYYQIGLTRMEQGDFESANEMFRKVIAVGPDTDMAEASKKAMINIGAMKRATKPWHIVSSLAWAYDSNIPNDPLDRPGVSPAPATDLGDQYQLFAFNAYYSFSFKNNAGMDMGYIFSYLNYSDPDNENSVGNSPYLLLKYSKKNWAADLRYSFGYYTADGKSKQKQHTLSPSVVFSEPRGMQTSLGLVYQDKDYQDDGLTPDSVHLALQAKQMFTIPGKNIWPSVGFTYGNENADTDASSYRYFETLAGVSMLLPYNIYGDLVYTDIRSDYDVTYGSNKRKDQGYMISTSFSRKVLDALTARISYLYVKNDSNVMTVGMAPNYDPYKYDKHIVQVQMEVLL